MLKRIRCLIKGHYFVMQYCISKACYYSQEHDRCKYCNRKRSNEL